MRGDFCASYVDGSTVAGTQPCSMSGHRRVGSPVSRKPISKIWHEARARSDAVQTVRAAGAGADRAELRAMLERELAGRGLAERPLWYEQTLDQLGASRAQEAQRTAEGWKALGRIGLGVVKAISERKLPDLSRPGWLDPPAGAAYGVPRNARDRWTAAQLVAAQASGLIRGTRW